MVEIPFTYYLSRFPLKNSQQMFQIVRVSNAMFFFLFKFRSNKISSEIAIFSSRTRS